MNNKITVVYKINEINITKANETLCKEEKLWHHLVHEQERKHDTSSCTAPITCEELEDECCSMKIPSYMFYIDASHYFKLKERTVKGNSEQSCVTWWKENK